MVLAAIALFGVAGLASSNPLVAAADTSPPRVAALDFQPRTVDVSNGPATVTVTARLTDETGAGTWVQASQPSTVVFKSPHGQVTSAIMDGAKPASGTAKDGQYSVTMTIPANAEAGAWRVDHIYLVDTLLNFARLETADVAALGFPTTLTVISRGADTTAPRLLAFGFSPTAVDTSTGPAVITLTARLADDVSGVHEGVGTPTQFNFRSPSGSSLIGGMFNHRASGTQLDGVYRYEMKVPQGSEPGTWVLSSFLLADQAGNQLRLSGEQVAAFGFPTTFVVRSQAPTATPTRVATATPTKPATPTPAATTASPATATPTATPTPTTAATATVSPSATATATRTAAPTVTVTLTPTATPAGGPPTATPTPGALPPATGGDDGGDGIGRVALIVGVGLAMAVVPLAVVFASTRGHRPKTVTTHE